MNDIDLLRNVSARYARCVDQREFDQLPDIMMPDVRIALYPGDPKTHEPFREMSGLPQIQAGFEFLRRYQRTFHLLGQQWVFELSADSARGETYCVAYHFHHKDGKDHAFVMYIRYQDSFVRCGDHWKLQERLLIVDRTEGQDIDS